jgi:hypothetical protein
LQPMQLDGSDSIGQKNFETMTSTLGKVLNSMIIGPSDVQVGVIQFAGKWTFNDLEEPSVAADHEVDFSLNTFDGAGAMLAKVKSLKLMGGTASYIGDAIIKAALPMFEEGNGGRASIPGALTAEEGRVIKHLVIITDSVSGEAKSELEQAAALAKLQGVKIYTVGIGAVCVPNDPNQGPCFDQAQMEILASSETKMKSVATFAALPTLEKDLANIPCMATYAPSSTPTTSPTRNPSAGPTEFPTYIPTVKPSVEPSAGPTEFPTLEPTMPPTPAPTECIARLDLVFVVDGTDSIDAPTFVHMKDEISNFVHKYEREIGLSDVRIALIQFGAEVHVEDGYDPVIAQKYSMEFDLDDYSSAEGILGAVKRMQQLGGNITLAQEPINMAQQVLTNDTEYQPNNDGTGEWVRTPSGSLGARPYVPKAIVLMTDGNFFHDDPVSAAKAAKTKGTHIFVFPPSDNPCSAVAPEDCVLLEISSDQKTVAKLDSNTMHLTDTVCVEPRNEPTCANVIDVVFVVQTGGNGRTGFVEDENGVTRQMSLDLYQDAKDIIVKSVQQLLISKVNVHAAVVQIASEPADPCPEQQTGDGAPVPTPSAAFPFELDEEEPDVEDEGELAADESSYVSEFADVTLSDSSATMTEEQTSSSATPVESSHSRRLQTLSQDPAIMASGVILVTASPTAEPAPPTEAPTIGAVVVTAEPTPVPAPHCDWTECRQTYRNVIGWEGQGGGVGGGSFAQNDVLAQVVGMEEAAEGNDEIGMFQDVVPREKGEQCKMTDKMSDRLFEDFIGPDAPGARRNAQKVVVLITDGADAGAFMETAAAAKEAGAAMMVVELIPSKQFDDGSFQAGGFAQLQQIATQSVDNRFQYRFASPIKQLFDIETVGEQLVTAFCDFRAEVATTTGSVKAPARVAHHGGSGEIIVGSGM